MHLVSYIIDYGVAGIAPMASHRESSSLNLAFIKILFINL